MKKLNDLFYSFLQVAASTQKLGINLIRISILIIFVWIGGLKFWNYEAEGIVPFVANSPFMSFFYTKSAPEYKTYKLKEGEFDQAKHEWHQENNTYGFSLGNLDHGDRYLDFPRHFLAEDRFGRSGVGYNHDVRDVVLLGHDSGGLGT